MEKDAVLFDPYAFETMRGTGKSFEDLEQNHAFLKELLDKHDWSKPFYIDYTFTASGPFWSGGYCFWNSRWRFFDCEFIDYSQTMKHVRGDALYKVIFKSCQMTEFAEWLL